MNKNFIDFLKEVKKKLPNAADDDIINEIAMCGLGDVDDFVDKFLKARVCHGKPKDIFQAPTKKHLFRKKALEKTLETNDSECLRMLCNMVYFNSDGKKMCSILNLKRNDDFEIVRESLKCEEIGDIIKSVLGNTSNTYCTLTYDDKRYKLLGVDDIKELIRVNWRNVIFPMVMTAPQLFENIAGHDTECRYYDDVIVPLLCGEFDIEYNGVS